MGLGACLVALAEVVLDNCVAPSCLLAEQDRVCAITNTPCCTWINVTGQVKVNVKEIYTQAKWFPNFGRGNIASLFWSTVKKVLPKLTWSLPFLGPFMAIVVCLTFWLSLHLLDSNSLK